MGKNVIEFSILGKDQFSKAMNSARTSLNLAAKAATGFGVAFAAGAGVAAKSLIEVGSTTENFKIRMDSMLGSVAEGNQVFQDMTKFASEVPFAYEEIMGAATQLSGILKGGAKEINETMPLIADLAAVSGLSIEKTTEQITRMYSAGAASADLFRERGINAMLGFEAGVAVSAEETKKRIIAAFEDPASKFRGAAAKMATTWDGVMSMIGDKWFAIRSQIADAGVFNYFKSIAIAIDKWMGKALEDTTANAQTWANTIIDGMRSVMQGVGFVADMFRGLSAVWKGLEVLFASFAEGLYQTLLGIANAVRDIANMIPGVDVSPFETLESIAGQASQRTAELKNELNELVTSPMPSTEVERFAASVESTFKELQANTREARDAIAGKRDGGGQEEGDPEVEAMRLAAEQKFAILSQSLLTEREAEMVANEQRLLDLENYYLTSGMLDEEYRLNKEKLNEIHQANLAKTNDKAIAGSFKFGQAIRKMELGDAIGHASDMLNSLSSTSKTAFRIQKAAALAKAVVSLPSAVIQSYENGGGFPWGLIPASIMAARGAAQISMIKGGNLSGQAHAGLTNVPNEGTFLLDKGERVLSPNQNADLTNFLAGGEGGGSSVTIENVNVHILENATNADALLSMDDVEMERVVAGPIIDALNSLDRHGVRPVFAERGRY